MDIILIVVFSLLALAIGLALGFLLRYMYAKARKTSAEKERDRIISEAKEKAEAEKKSLIIEARDQILKERNEFEKESRESRNELQKLERRLYQKEENLEKKIGNLDDREAKIANREKRISQQEEELQEAVVKHRKELERISGLSVDEARNALVASLEEEAKTAAARTVENIEKTALETGEKKARDIIVQATQRLASEVTQDITVASVSLPGEEMKGRIIGREGRNIRTLETLTGVDVIIDDTPEAVVISCFDPVRREIARRSLEKLILDGRIHPARIEEVVERTTKDIEQTVMDEGEKARLDVNLAAVHPELERYIGRLHFRTSYGQNVLTHSKEVAQVAANIAVELGANVEMAKRGGFLHDIGKALETGEGGHAVTGAELVKRYGESKEIVNIVKAHHGDTECLTPEAVIVMAADAISAARPGARRESFDNYIKRLENLERIADEFQGVEKSFAIQAGRELRVMVKNDSVTDDKAKELAREIVKKIEKELKYPGIIRVTVIREMRVVEIAR